MPNEPTTDVPKESVEIKLEAPSFSGTPDPDTLAKLQSDFSRAYNLKQPMSAIPIYTPKNYFEQTAFYNGIMYANINNAWVAVGPTPAATKSTVRAYLAAPQSIGATTTATVAFDTVNFQTASEFDTASSTYTAPRTGKYAVYTQIEYSGHASGQRFFIQIKKSGSTTAQAAFYSADTNAFTRTAYDVISMAANDTLTVSTRNFGAGTLTLDSGSGITYITIHEL